MRVFVNVDQPYLFILDRSVRPKIDIRLVNVIADVDVGFFNERTVFVARKKRKCACTLEQDVLHHVGFR